MASQSLGLMFMHGYFATPQALVAAIPDALLRNEPESAPPRQITIEPGRDGRRDAGASHAPLAHT